VLALVEKLRAEGRDIVSLGAGEPDFDTPEHVRRAAVTAIADGRTRYTPIGGTAALKAAVCRKFRRDNGLEFSDDEILISSGAKQSLFNLCQAVLSDGDEAVIAAPYWVSYPDMVRLAGACPVIVSTAIEGNFKLSPEDLDAALSERTRLLVLNSPSNPTGAAYSADELAALGDVLTNYPDVVVASDDIYEHIFWGDGGFATIAGVCPQLRDRTVTVNGVSKAYAMTGWRIGYAAGSETIIRAMTTIQSQSTSNACSISQAAAVAALDGDQGVVAHMCEAYRQRHDLLLGMLGEMPGIQCRPADGTFYLLPNVTGVLENLNVKDDIALAERLLNDGGVACVPGTAFGAPGHIRLSYACSMDTLGEAVRRLKRVLVP
jgi:aspartate aminotransferase